MSGRYRKTQAVAEKWKSPEYLEGGVPVAGGSRQTDDIVTGAEVRDCRPGFSSGQLVFVNVTQTTVT